MEEGNMDFEKKLDRLENLVNKMESGELTLEESLKAFEEGVKLSRECQTELNQAELRVKKLLSVDEDGRIVSEDFTASN